MNSIARIAVPSNSINLCSSRTLRDGAPHPNAGVAHIVSPHSGKQVTAPGRDDWYVLIELQLEMSRSRTGDLNMFLRAMLFLPALHVDLKYPASLEHIVTGIQLIDLKPASPNDRIAAAPA